MTYAIQELVIRDVAPVDTGEITDLVAAAMSDGPVARWLQPDDTVRAYASPPYFDIFVEHAVRYGEVYATVPANGQGRGQVKVVVSGRQRILQAVSVGESIATGITIRVVEVRPDNSVVVTPANI